MANGTIITNNGLKIVLNRTYKASPDYLSPTKFKIGTGTTTPAVGDTDVQTGVNINGGATKSFVSSYPVLDETNLQSTIRCFLNSVEGNGNNLSEFGVFNVDGSPLMFSHAVFTAITKTANVEVSIVQKEKID